jgi:hypothetical protein
MEAYNKLPHRKSHLTILAGVMTMPPNPLIEDIRGKLNELEELLIPTGGTLSMETLTAVARESYSGLFDTRNHIQDLAGRILAAAAFFTAAAGALFKTSYDRLESSPTSFWPTFFFSFYLLGVLAGAMFLLAAMWPAVWNAILKTENSQKVKEEFKHTFSHPKNAFPIDDAGSDIKAATYREELMQLYWRERTSVLDDSKAITELLRWGGISLMISFFAFVQLAATLFFEQGCQQWATNAIGTTLLSAGMTAANFIRREYTSERFRSRPDPWRWVWVAVTILGIFVSIWRITVEKRCERPPELPSIAHYQNTPG